MICLDNVLQVVSKNTHDKGYILDQGTKCILQAPQLQTQWVANSPFHISAPGMQLLRLHIRSKILAMLK